ncbi:hypothetical protein GVO57_05530 [Sphingomonas changnyeongensis]|uniref:Phosphatidate cytidylyltransferase n=1 Tax=Sphingomonas changnyeongensis TaxID=2698679 RepID=A0A7Z2NYK1_9SPHN|nr:hypothetical protein [Sphingomonas changnyeongensis]QHL91809.1 hypothetical protein GVO57_05530 [Sphingomonas changnyeongensis]
MSAAITAELDVPVDPRIAALARQIAARHPGAVAMIFYGSCLRSGTLEGQMLDFYLIVRDYRAAYPARWLAVANRLVPPNVFPFTSDGLAAKYAVLSLADLEAQTGPGAASVSVWARFAQPVRLVWAADDGARAAVAGAVAQAVATMWTLAPPDADPLARWRAGFTLTYGAELRAERGDRPGSIVDWDPARYLGLARLLAHLPDRHSDRRWAGLRRRGKALTVLRLAKASLTFAGGIDYLAWKINRHAGTGIEIRPWQRRWPLIAALVLLPRLLRAGAVR